MTLYLYKAGSASPALAFENVVSYTDGEVRTVGGTLL